MALFPSSSKAQKPIHRNEMVSTITACNMRVSGRCKLMMEVSKGEHSISSCRLSVVELSNPLQRTISPQGHWCNIVRCDHTGMSANLRGTWLGWSIGSGQATGYVTWVDFEVGPRHLEHGLSRVLGRARPSGTWLGWTVALEAAMWDMACVGPMRWEQAPTPWLRELAHLLTRIDGKS
jgi:hypothetical protein